MEQLGTFLSSIIQEIGRKIKDGCELKKTLSEPLRLVERVMTQRPRDGAGCHVQSVHARKVECIVKGKAHRPCEFGSMLSLVTPIRKPGGAQLVAHVMALPENVNDGKTLKTVLPGVKGVTGESVNEALVDRRYRGNHVPPEYKGKVVVAGQKQNIPAAVKKRLRRRNAVEPVIGHVKNEHRMDRNYLAHAQGDAINAVLAAVGYNLRLLFKWMRIIFSFSVESLSFPDTQNGTVHFRLPPPILHG